VFEDVKRIKAHPLVADQIPVYGYIHDCNTGQLVEVPEATAAGKPTLKAELVTKAGQSGFLTSE